MRLFFVAAFFVILLLIQLFSGSLVLDGKWVHRERIHEFSEPPFSWDWGDPFGEIFQSWSAYPRMFYLNEYTTFSNDLYDALQIIRLPASAAQDEIDIHDRSVHLVGNTLSTISEQGTENDSFASPVKENIFHMRYVSPHEVGIPEAYQRMNGVMENGKPFRRFDLHRKTATRFPTYAWKRFFIALDLYKNEDLIFFLTGALVAYIEDEIAPFFNVQNSVVVSIFTNNPSAELHSLIYDFLLPHLRRAGVHYIYTALDGTCFGYTTRPRWMGRIEWMACVRNKALEPLYVWGMRVFDAGLYKKPFDCGEKGRMEKGSACVNLYLRGTRLDRVTMSLRSRDNMTPDSLSDDIDGDKMVVLFFNDIYFRPSDITSLLESVQESTAAPETHLDGVVHESKKSADTTEGKKSNADSVAEGTSFDMACGMDFYYSFYDTWVSRDVRGEPFLPHMPFTEDPATQNALRRIISAASNDGDLGRQLSIPVKCCWNGVAAVRGRLFIRPIRRDAKKQSSLKGEEKKEAAGKRGMGEESVELWGGVRYHRVTDAPGQVYKMHEMTLLQRLVNNRRSWVNRMDREAKKEGLTFSRHINRDIRSVREEYNANMLLELNNGMRHLANEVQHSHYNYYRADAPSLRFRHALMPSFGGTVEEKYTVSDDVCHASECLLFCQDVMHAAILDGRAPVVLMNPNVRVAYEPAHFNFVTGWLYNSPTIFRMAIWLNYVLVWVRSIFGFPDMVLHDKQTPFPTSSADDWTAGEVNRIVNVLYGKEHSLELNVTKSTSMTCFFPGSDDATRTILLPFCRLLSIMFCTIISVWMICKATHGPLGERLSNVPLSETFIGGRRRWMKLFDSVKWRILRAVFHPRGKLFFGCPRVLCLICRRILVLCGYRMPVDPDTNSLTREPL